MNSTTTPAVSKRPSPMVVCDICHQDFVLTKGCLTENNVTLEKRGLEPKEVVLTTLECPCCGKQYPVIMDDEETMIILEKLTELHKRMLILQQKNRRVHAKMDQKYRALENKLRFKRKNLVSEYNKSFYQSADGKQQLDLHYHG